MSRAALPTLALATMLAASAAQASPFLLAMGTLGGTSDLSGLTGTLENGLPANILGGLGSGLAYAGGNTFLALPDRGPNATSYNSSVDDTVSYINRFQTVNLSLTRNTSGSGLAYKLSPTLTGTTLLYSPSALTYGSGTAYGLPSGAPAQNTSGKNYFTGRSDNYGTGTSGNPTDARFDPESIRVSNDGKSVFISDEYGPYVRQFNRSTGALEKTFTLPANLDVANKAPTGAAEISGNASGRTANKGMEGLSITPDGKTLVGIMQAALIQDAGNKSTKKMVRIVTIDIATGATHEYGYILTAGSGVSDVLAVNDHEFLVDERDGAGLGGDPSNAPVKQVYKIDLAGATDITNLTGKDAAAAAVGKTQFLDVAGLLESQGGLSPDQVTSKIEGLSFGQDLTIDGTLTHTLYVSNDNDFVPGTAGPNQFFVFGVTDADLPGYVAQQISAVPLPKSLPLFAAALGGLGLLGWRRKAGRA